MTRLNLSPEWRDRLKLVLEQSESKQLFSFLTEEIEDGKTIYPALDQIFDAFNTTSFSQVKVVILGQDPYHGPNQAHGMAFSVLPGSQVPPSLRNIYKELSNSSDFVIPESGYLEPWARSGVLLLNSVLSVEAGKPGSHQKMGWEAITDFVISDLSRSKDHLVFLLWGAFAQKKSLLIDESKHLILTAPHPSPLSAYRGFLGCNHFNLANQYLMAHKLPPVNWQN